MTLNLSDAKWLKIVLLLAVPIIAIVGWAWLSGYFYLELAGLDGRAATPWTLYQYWYYYGEDKATQSWLTISGLGGLIVVCLPLLVIFSPAKRKLFGDAKWATTKDIAKAGLFADDGIIVGQKTSFMGLSKRFLVYGGNQHALMSAPTRSGKGVSVVIPTLLTWSGSTVILDLKQENWDITSGFRSAHGQDCYLLNLAPRNHRTHRWNPLYYISDDPAFRINDIQKIGQMLFPKIDNEAPIWQSSARSLWLGIVLYLIETDELPVTMGEALRQLTMGDERLAEIIEERQESDNPLSRECYLALKEYLDTPDKTRGSVRKGFTAALELFYNPMIDAATAENDFDLRDLRKKRMSVYVAITPDDLDRLAPLINLFFQQVIDQNTRELPEQNPELKYQCLLLPDEFTAMGKVGILSKSISYIAGYGLRMLPIIQSPAQLREVYGADATETFMENHALQIIFAPKNIKVAKEISETLGTTTVKNKSRTRQLVGKASRSENASDHSRALLLPQEVKGIGEKAEILIMENTPPIRCEKVTWYKEKVFSERGNNLKALEQGDPDAIKWPSPEVPKLDPSSRKMGELDFRSNTVSEANRTVIERPVTAQDIENIDSLDLDNFSCDFSKIEVPKGDIDDEAMDALVNDFFDVMAA
ncbi:type IV secretory system conjugative DNA transfer family protein [Halomonas sp. HP20-15]|uniref:type IV secretory system conjugative DNA transfer family protein n=1 Tax=Halomonas sp. HP20-15 TaxID=3085901 RepID=UPI0029821698|nr:type IV secretory system conjugative DNA transfer family protein [Halomonas sp. HP20-15]MDW5378838.1 type IV secretory system conjugative DNA transfer family protein [Halomonas sp. HP20-15]